mmetsp:Transcript_51988/g.145034  ORF Transcript_51988/g.145034 Transcript_51988/m.145034 type:complete len:545 (-) Transcript_51988:146-1780(-)
MCDLYELDTRRIRDAQRQRGLKNKGKTDSERARDEDIEICLGAMYPLCGCMLGVIALVGIIFFASYNWSVNYDNNEASKWLGATCTVKGAEVGGVRTSSTDEHGNERESVTAWYADVKVTVVPDVDTYWSKGNATVLMSKFPSWSVKFHKIGFEGGKGKIRAKAWKDKYEGKIGESVSCWYNPKPEENTYELARKNTGRAKNEEKLLAGTIMMSVSLSIIGLVLLLYGWVLVWPGPYLRHDNPVNERAHAIARTASGHIDTAGIARSRLVKKMARVFVNTQETTVKTHRGAPLAEVADIEGPWVIVGDDGTVTAIEVMMDGACLFAGKDYGEGFHIKSFGKAAGSSATTYIRGDGWSGTSGGDDLVWSKAGSADSVTWVRPGASSHAIPFIEMLVGRLLLEKGWRNAEAYLDAIKIMYCMCTLEDLRTRASTDLSSTAFTNNMEKALATNLTRPVYAIHCRTKLDSLRKDISSGFGKPDFKKLLHELKWIEPGMSYDGESMVMPVGVSHEESAGPTEQTEQTEQTAITVSEPEFPAAQGAPTNI